MQTNPNPNTPQRRRISAKQLRAFMHELADDICCNRDRLNITVSANTFELHLDGGTINISYTAPEKGGNNARL